VLREVDALGKRVNDRQLGHLANEGAVLEQRFFFSPQFHHMFL